MTMASDELTRAIEAARQALSLKNSAYPIRRVYIDVEALTTLVAFTEARAPWAELVECIRRIRIAFDAYFHGGDRSRYPELRDAMFAADDLLAAHDARPAVERAPGADLVAWHHVRALLHADEQLQNLVDEASGMRWRAARDAAWVALRENDARPADEAPPTELVDALRDACVAGAALLHCAEGRGEPGEYADATARLRRASNVLGRHDNAEMAARPDRLPWAEYARADEARQGKATDESPAVDVLALFADIAKNEGRGVRASDLLARLAEDEDAEPPAVTAGEVEEPTNEQRICASCALDVGDGRQPCWLCRGGKAARK